MCGFLGIYGPDGVDVAPELYEGLLAVQHRGQDAAGITTFTDTFHTRKGFGLVRDVFSANDMGRLCGNLGVAHVRYPTVGTGTSEDAQPFHVNFPVGVAMAHNGNVTNFQELREMTMRNACTRLNSSCDLEVILYVFARALSERLKPGIPATHEDVFAAVAAVFREVRGAYSVVALVPDVGLLAFRDPFGIKPAILGKKETEDGVWYAAASESVVLDVIGYEVVSDLAAGEAILVDTSRRLHRKKLSDKPHRPCIFELVYFARPDSMLDRISVYKTRRRFGRALANQWRESGAPTPDVVIPVPDSSRDAAMALAQELDLPYREGLVKNRYIGRTFIMGSNRARQASIRLKLNPIQLEFEGKDVLLVDDSIVRGNTSRQIVELARRAGARKVYFASVSPPLRHPCVYGIDMSTKNEFIAKDRSPEEVAEAIGADGVVYQTLENLVAAVREGNPQIQATCNACFSGVYPTGDVTEEQLARIEAERLVER
jgi:amidophosphoribosyltransferase